MKRIETWPVETEDSVVSTFTDRVTPPDDSTFAAANTTFHWEQFNKGLNGEDRDLPLLNGEDVTVANGPPPEFKKAIELNKFREECISDEAFTDSDTPQCFGNPDLCEDGFSFAFYFLATYNDDQSSFVDKSQEFDQEVFATSQHDPSLPGFTVYRQGGTLGAIVRSKTREWHVSAPGIIPQPNTWANLGFRWKLPRHEVSDDEMKQPSFSYAQLGGLQLYLEGERLTFDVFGEEICSEDCESEPQAPRMTIGCRPIIPVPPEDTPPAEEEDAPESNEDAPESNEEAPESNEEAPGSNEEVAEANEEGNEPVTTTTPAPITEINYASGRFDEIVFFERYLKDADVFYFQGDHEEIDVNNNTITSDQLLDLIGDNEVSDPILFEVVAQVLTNIVANDETISDTTSFGNRYIDPTTPMATTAESETTVGNGTTVSANTTEAPETTEGSPPKTPVEELNDLLIISKKLMDISGFNTEFYPKNFDIRLMASVPILEILSGKGSFADHWREWNQNPNARAPQDFIRDLINYLKFVGERRSELKPATNNSGHFIKSYGESNFGLQMFKLTAEEFAAFDQTNGNNTNMARYWTFPPWHLPTWVTVQDRFNLSQDNSAAFKDYAEIPNELFTGDCRTMQVTFVGLHLDTFPDIGRKNPAAIPASHIELDSSIMALDALANRQGDIADTEGIDRNFNPRCDPDEKLLVRKPLHIRFMLKSERHNFGRRKLQSYFDSFETSLIRTRYCVIWNPEISTSGAWDTEGVKTEMIDDDRVKCTSTKFGIFAVVAEIEDLPFAEDDAEWLYMAKVAGYGVSIAMLLAFIVIVLVRRHLWEMFHMLNINYALALILAHTFMLLTDLTSVRDNRDLCTLVGTLMSFFYTASASIMAMQTFAVFRALIVGIINGRTKVYLAFAWGYPILCLGGNIYVHLRDMGRDARCMVAFRDVVNPEDDPKWAFFASIGLATSFGLIMSLVSFLNLCTANVREKKHMPEVISLAVGLLIYNLFTEATWIMAPLAYVDFSSQELPDLYAPFQLCNAFSGLVFFLFVALISKRFRDALCQCGPKKSQLDDEFDYDEFQNEDRLSQDRDDDWLGLNEDVEAPDSRLEDGFGELDGEDDDIEGIVDGGGDDADDMPQEGDGEIDDSPLESPENDGEEGEQVADTASVKSEEAPVY